MTTLARQMRRKQATGSMKSEITKLEREIELLKNQIGQERLQRVSAQRGLVPYVRSLQTLDAWLLERPELRAQLESILRELGLWEIKLGYDPAEDPEVRAAVERGEIPAWMIALNSEAKARG
jgi:hypothetical protein